MTSAVSPGDVLLGKYRVERVLGKGGMGVVVAARHIALGELFAIKLLLPAALESPGATERFLREARASARLKGEHVVKVQDVGTLPDGAPYMVMEHLAGSDLKDVVRQRGPLQKPRENRFQTTLQLMEALQAALNASSPPQGLSPSSLSGGAASPRETVKMVQRGLRRRLHEPPDRHLQLRHVRPALRGPDADLRQRHLPVTFRRGGTNRTTWTAIPDVWEVRRHRHEV
jgi:hypothetical protein